MPEKRLKIGRKSVKYKVRRHLRARYLRLSVGYDGVVTVTLPSWVPRPAAESFIKEKSLWLLDKISQFEKVSRRQVVFDRDHYLRHKERARTEITARIRQWNRCYGFKYNRISIKNCKSQWGSCSSKGNLNFNYRLLFLPESLRDYVIVHELCHLKEMNHSPRFWRLVEKVMPDYNHRRNLLARHEIRLM